MTETAVLPTPFIHARTEGLKVRTRDGGVLGSLHALIVDKRSGQASYAVLRTGGFLGLNMTFYPVPYEHLIYDAFEDALTVMIDRTRFEGGPSWTTTSPEIDQAYADRILLYYSAAGTPILPK